MRCLSEHSHCRDFYAGRRRLIPGGCGTVCRRTSRQRRHRLFCRKRVKTYPFSRPFPPPNSLQCCAVFVISVTITDLLFTRSLSYPGRTDVQDSADVIPAVSESVHLVAHQRTQHSIVVRPTAVRAISTDIICQTIVQHCHTSDLELTATCCVKLRRSLYFQIQT